MNSRGKGQAGQGGRGNLSLSRRCQTALKQQFLFSFGSLWDCERRSPELCYLAMVSGQLPLSPLLENCSASCRLENPVWDRNSEQKLRIQEFLGQKTPPFAAGLMQRINVSCFFGSVFLPSHCCSVTLTEPWRVKKL